MRALFIHGVGTQSAGYSTYAQKHLAAGLAGRRTLYGQEVVWADLLDEPERLLMKQAKRRGSSGRPLQRLVVETLADALCYEHRLDSILDRIDVAYLRLRATAPVVVVGHSLGCLLLMKWLEQRPRLAVERFVATGCNLPLFNIGAKFHLPPQLPGERVYNYFDAQDMLGYPVGQLIPGARDVEVNVGGWFTRWNGLSHLGYWGEKSLWRKTVAGDLV